MTNSKVNGFDLSDFDATIVQLEQLGENMKQIAERVLDAGSEPARQAFIRNVPYSKKDKEHARDNVIVSKTRTAKKSRSRYRLVGALDEKFRYLYYVENGHIRAPAHPFIDRAYADAREATVSPMEDALIREVEEHLR